MMLSTLRAPARGRRRRALTSVGLLTGVLGAQLTLSSPAGAETFQAYEDQTYAAAPTSSDPTTPTSPTADKPQSKLWYADGSWWALMRTAVAGPDGNPDVTVHELMPNHTWRNTGIVVDGRASSSGDALREPGRLVVASRATGTTSGVRVARLSYDAATSRYSMDAGFPVTLPATTVESVTIDRDGQGRLWATWTQPDPATPGSDQVMVAHSTSDDATWIAPYQVPVTDSTVAPDDISAIVAFGGKVGIMYSDQQDQVVHFAVHDDSAADDAGWALEKALDGTRSADDHLNLKSLLQDDGGRIYAAIKTSRGDDPTDQASDPDIQVLTRSSDGTWIPKTVATVADKMTRPQLAIDATNRELYVIMSTLNSGAVYYKKSALAASPNFSASGKGTPLLKYDGAYLDDATTAKAPVTAESGLVVLASDNKERRYYHAEFRLAGATGGGNAAGTFTDVPPGAPFAADIEWLSAQGITQGYADGTFRPDKAVLRQQMAVFLYHFANRTAAVPDCSTSPFPDVPASSAYCGSITWLSDAGITRGTADGKFRPLGTVTRQQMAVFIYHLAHDGATPPPCTSAEFTDVPKDSAYCGAISWLSTTGLTSSSGSFGPNVAVTRGMMAAFLHRLEQSGI